MKLPPQDCHFQSYFNKKINRKILLVYSTALGINAGVNHCILSPEKSSFGIMLTQTVLHFNIMDISHSHGCSPFV